MVSATFKSSMKLGRRGHGGSLNTTLALPVEFGILVLTAFLFGLSVESAFSAIDPSGERSPSNMVSEARKSSGPFVAFSAISDQAVDQDETTTIPFEVAVSDPLALGRLQVSGNSSNTNLIRREDILVSGSGTGWQITIQPATNQTGICWITITAQAGGPINSVSFLLTVKPANTPPTISSIPNWSAPRTVSAGPIEFAIEDKETPPELLTIEKSSSNKAWVPDSDIAINGIGTNRTVTILANAGAIQEGQTVITLTVRDAEGLSASASFRLTFNRPPNSPPTISTILNQATVKNISAPIIPFTVFDKESPLDRLRVTAESSNQTLVPNENLVLSGVGTNRVLSIRPAPGQVGTTTIRLTVTDDGVLGSIPKWSRTSFTLMVVPQAPAISSIADQTVVRNNATPPIAFTVVGESPSASSVTVTGNSRNLKLVPDANILIAGDGANRTVTILPATNQVGTAVITVTASERGNVASTSFLLTVKRPAVVRGDLNRDGMADILFRDADGFLGGWLMNGARLASATYLNPSHIGDTNYRTAKWICSSSTTVMARWRCGLWRASGCAAPSCSMGQAPAEHGMWLALD